ncbi:PARP catalytic domain-containing protein [Caenorhabditis elegans]|uniref:PARP catalytic domain-containing protein n=1 Tax=Caenorhabditis elegans TaxID=6239 RepID=Q20408_CAEEL|nr:PARP catalytic domain-containing protein [Caenorhabditis elegans]CAA85459.1 PARP catalytic domain-containing protein [Caenorhabditis elegans]|eukprot:NP_496350.1 Uncharacterized protein CELE_F44F4.10 [Caenorhabditis elegans]
MNDGNSRTPYNSLYKPLNLIKSKPDGCCKHNGQCPYGKNQAESVDDGNSRTPYNSIYEPLSLNKSKPDSQCSNGKKPADDEYVNLLLPQSKEEQVAEKLADKLRKLEVKESKGKRRGSKERKKKKPEPVESTYESLASIEGSTNFSGPVTTESLESNVKCHHASQTAYIGVYSSADAEAQVKNRGEFALYHQFEVGNRLDHLTATLPLMLVYYTTTKKHRHYPVRKSGDNGTVQYSVDCGYPIVRKHFSINQLVLYYKTFGSIQMKQEDICSEEFSWWLE